MEPMQEHRAHHAPEVVHTTHYPEAVGTNHYQHNGTGHTGEMKPEHGFVPGSHQSVGTPYSAYGGSSQFDHNSPPSTYAQPATGFGAAHHNGDVHDEDKGRKRKGATICGCTALVFALCVVIAILAAAVVGLAAGTGVEARKANDANDRADRYQASASQASAATVTVTSSSPTSTSFAAIDDNCSGNPDGVTGTSYKAFSVIGDYTFTLQCNADAAGSPLMSLFVADINTCMDACASWSKYLGGAGSDTNSTIAGANSTCGAVSFIPSWTNKTTALNAGNGAPGNCYLKPTSTDPPTTPSGQEVHAGILQSS